MNGLGLGVGGVELFAFFLPNFEFRTILNSSSWDNNDVLVVCKQLGYSTVNYSVCSNSKCVPIDCPAARFFKLWTNEVHCSGQEENLIDCAASWTPSHFCFGTYKAASVSCAGKINWKFIIPLAI